METENGPRTDVSDISTYAYYSCITGSQCGQLHTVTNALGHITTYDTYNAHGQPTRITDANGLVTALVYDARQRLTDRCVGATWPGCVGGELTHLDYWPTGLLKKVTNPDASYIEYTYDAAHRHTEIKDGALNKIVYTLDAMGNRTAENTYDPSLSLKRTHTRVFPFRPLGRRSPTSGHMKSVNQYPPPDTPALPREWAGLHSDPIV